MKCTVVDVDGIRAIVCRSGQRRERVCKTCQAPATKLCDRVVKKGHTCNAPMCDAHAHVVGNNRDFCPACVSPAPDPKKKQQSLPL